MKLRFLLIVITAVLLASVGSAWAMQTPEPTSTPTPDSACVFPDTLATEELYERSITEYDRLLEATPGLPCAQHGVITTIPKLTPSPELTSTPTAVPTATPDQLAVAKRLQKEGYGNEAKDIVREEIKKNPEISLDDDYTSLDGNPWNDGPSKWPDATWSWVSSKTAPFVGMLPTIVTILAISAILWQLFRLRRTETSLDIAVFNTELDGSSLGQALTESVQAAYRITQDAREAGSTKLVSEAPAAAPTTISANLLTAPSGYLAPILDWVSHLGNTTYVLNGTTVTDPVRGAGLVLSLKHGNSIHASQTIWFSKYFWGSTRGSKDDTPTGNAFLALAETAGIWVFSEMAQLPSSTERRLLPSLIRGWLKRTSLADDEDTAGVSETSSPGAPHVRWQDWESYALFRNSRTALAWSDRQTAIGLLHMSLQREPGFIPALLNLYTLEMEQEISRTQSDQAKPDPDPAEIKAVPKLYGDYTEAADAYAALLETVWNAVNDDDLSWEKPGDDDLRDMTRARVLFNFAAATDYAVPWDATNPASNHRLEQSLARALQKARNSSILDHTQMLVPLEQLVYIYRYRRDVGFRDGARDAYELARLTSPWVSQAFGPQSQYGLACFCSAVLYFENAQGERTRWAGRALSHLRKAVDLSAGVREWAQYDPHLLPLRLACKDEFKKTVETSATDEPKETEKKEEDSSNRATFANANIFQIDVL